MKTITSLTFILLLLLTGINAYTQRYLYEVFDEVDVQSSVVYGANYTILTYPVTGHSDKEDLLMDLYTPSGDQVTDRPLVLFFHGGNFLPHPQNGLTTGIRTDSFAVELCSRLARMGYVAASVDYRLGWNPLSGSADVIKQTLINAIYRGVQDARTAIRYFRKSVAEGGNPFGICPEKFVLMGEGLGGGYLVLASATIDNYFDLVIPKFIGPDIDGDGFPDPMVIETVNGDPDGASIVGINPLNEDTLAIPNHPGYSSEAQLCVNLSGAIADTSWLDGSDPPFISFHVPNDPFVPYAEEVLVVHPGLVVLEVQGSYLVAQRANLLGNNQVFVDANIQDAFTTVANMHNNGYEGLFPLLRPVWNDPFYGGPAYEHAPWAWWDVDHWSAIPHPSCPFMLPLSECNYHVINALNNPDMSGEKGRTYTDTIIGYFAPRAYAALHLNASCFTGSDTPAIEKAVSISIAPNPANDNVQFSSQADLPLLSIQLYDLSGLMVRKVEGINNSVYVLKRNDLQDGLYLAKVILKRGIITKKILFIR